MYEGVFTALVTPFLEDGKIDESTLRQLVDIQIDEGVHGVVPTGTTGESPSLSHDEHIEVIRIVTEQVKGRVPVIAGTGSNSTKEAVDLTTKAKELGADASLQVAPYYNKPTQNGLYEHYTKIAEEVDLPLIVYNIPGRSGVNISNDTLLKLAKHKNIIGVKDATGNVNQMMDLLAKRPPNFTVLSGDDNLSFLLIALGGNGAISVASNLIPGKMADFIIAANSGDYEDAREMHYQLLPLFKALFIETNPIPIKAAMAHKGLLREVYRLPMCPMVKENREKLISVLESMDI
jgi:4-hydroxy-tetrahydrodipicolinate synthase